MTERQPINLAASRRYITPGGPTVLVASDTLLALVEAVEATWLYWMQEGRGDDFEPVRLALTPFDFSHLDLP